MFNDKILLITYLVSVFILNLFVYMIAEYYRRVVDKKLNPIGFIISMCAISAAVGGSFVKDYEIFTAVMTAAMMTAGISSILNGIELYFFTRKTENNHE